jgi:hypothetical protein
MSRTGAWRGACAAGSVTSIRVGSSAWFGSVGLLFIELAKRFIRAGLNSFALMEIIISG